MAVAAGERRIVTVLVADVVDSTGIGESLGPERSKFLMDEVVRIMTTHVRRYDGTVAQIVGDEVLALFGAPLAHEDDSERAVRAAVAIQRALARYAEEVEAAYGVELAVRVGVNTGPVVVASDGDDDGHVRWNALGDTVNVASRLQELAGAGEVAVGVTTARQVEECFELEPLGERELKGKTAPVATYRVVNLREGSRRGADGPLVGREFELTVLERTMDGLAEGRGVIASIVGEAGIGKTRLAAEIRERYGDRIRFLEGRAVSYAQNFPYWPIRELVHEWLGVGVTTPEARVRLELKAQVTRLFGERAEDAYGFLASLLGVTLEPDAAERLRELNRESIQHQTFATFAELVCRLASDEPVCLVLEDLHWADDSTLALLEELLHVTDEAAVGLLLLYRTEREHASWHLGERARQRFPHRYREMELRPLPADAARTLVSAAADGELPESVAELLAERAGGNPFFLEEALRDLVERGALRREDGVWSLAVSPDELAIPTLVQGALQARLDRLDPETREVLSIAAVVGRTFGFPLLERVVPKNLVDSLSELQRLDLVVEVRRRPVPEYRFRHGLVQEVAYASLVEARRRRLHLRVGEALESMYAEVPEDQFAVLARHFAEADEPAKAVEYLLKAGDAARALYADEEALEHYRKARDFLARTGDDARARETLFKMALTHHLAFDFEAAEQAYDEAFCCKVEPPPEAPPTERLETRAERTDDLVPGDVYSTEGAFFAEHLFRGLLMVDRDLNVVPAMADNLRVSSDGLEYLFRLREGVRWSDGHPVTAEDFAFAWRSMREQRTRTAFLMADVESAEALDDRTLEVRLRAPRSYFPYILASAWSFPWPRHKCEEIGDDWRKPENLVSNGPFALTEYGDEEAVLTANPYWVGPRGNVREIVASFDDKRDADALASWRDGRYDVVQIAAPPDDVDPDAIHDVIPALGLEYVGFAADRPPFANELVRKAFSHAIDRERFVASRTTLARAASIGGAIPPAMPGHSHRVGPAYDVDLARKLLADGGFPGGQGLPELRFVVPEWLDPSDLIEQWASLGARVVPDVVAKTGWRDLAGSGHFWFTGWIADYPDPDGFFRGLFELAWPFYRDEDLDERLERARFLTDSAERMRLYHEIDRLWVAERAAILPMAYPRAALLRRPWVDGLVANPLSRALLDQVVVQREPAAAVGANAQLDIELDH